MVSFFDTTHTGSVNAHSGRFSYYANRTLFYKLIKYISFIFTLVKMIDGKATINIGMNFSGNQFIFVAHIPVTVADRHPFSYTQALFFNQR